MRFELWSCRSDWLHIRYDVMLTNRGGASDVLTRDLERTSFRTQTTILKVFEVNHNYARPMTGRYWSTVVSFQILTSSLLTNNPPPPPPHHHHHVPERLTVLPVPWYSRWSWSLHLFLGRPMFLRPFGLYCIVCFGSLFVSILCTCCSHFFWYCFISFAMFCAPVFFFA